jgi:hypothetical protein
MQGVFDGPMTPHGFAKLTGIALERGDGVAALDSELIPKVSFGSRHANALATHAVITPTWRAHILQY